MRAPHLVLGGPGCGKTTRLLEIVDRELEAGVPSERIAFVTFTKAAAEEARERASVNFGLDPDTDLPWFRTIHSLAYRALTISRDEIMDARDWKEFSEVVGHKVSGHYDVDVAVAQMSDDGNKFLRIIDYAATTMKGLVEVYHDLDEPVDWWQLRRFDAAFARYKVDSAKMDFTDLLLAYVREGKPVNVEVAIIDEGQDLTKAQWEVCRVAFSEARRVYVGGDDDQAIYRWAGADVDHFLSLSESPEVLSVSHRLPRSVFEVGARVSARISKRYSKPYRPADREGEVNWHMAPDDIDFSVYPGTWLLLARNNYLLARFEALAREQGIPYTRRDGFSIKPQHVEAAKLWERLRKQKQLDMSAGEVRLLLREGFDRKPPQLRESSRYTAAQIGITEAMLQREWYDALTGIDSDKRLYYTSCLRRGERLDKTPRVRIETIHGVKGAEADHVLLLSDVSRKTLRSFEAAPDHEHRVFYVGVTRAKESLHLVSPQSMSSYPL